jgi:hypothetical protein
VKEWATLKQLLHPSCAFVTSSLELQHSYGRTLYFLTTLEETLALQEPLIADNVKQKMLWKIWKIFTDQTMFDAKSTKFPVLLFFFLSQNTSLQIRVHIIW